MPWSRWNAYIGEIVKRSTTPACSRTRHLCHATTARISVNGRTAGSRHSRAKDHAWEGGVRVPGIRTGGPDRAGRESDGLFDLMDLFNTCLISRV